MHADAENDGGLGVGAAWAEAEMLEGARVLA